MRFRLGRCEITVSPLFTGFITILLFIDRTGTMSLFLLAVLIHEAGHFVFLAWFQCLPVAIWLLTFEINVVSPATAVSRLQQVLISLGGVFGGVLAGVLTRGDFSMVNWFLAGFSALPVYSMDGYQVLLLLCDRMWYQYAVRLLSIITISAIAGIGVWVFLCNHNPMLLLFCVYMSALQIRTKRRSCNNKRNGV
ncbi:MAG: hypothetical protein IKT68_05590 [Clostridia bacterium]|nr:hypothetical protein [Clostridia bacterium]